VGDQDHEFTLFRVNEEFDAEAIAEMFSQPPAEVSDEASSPEEEAPGIGELPPGAEEFLSHTDFPSGETKNIVFKQPLESGKYALVCCYPDMDDAAGAPHCGKGMIREFTVP
jgi:hypothetical protein